MKSILNNKDLEDFLLKHAENGGVGVLISGGYEPDGSIPLLEHLTMVKRIKKKTNLVINAHIGLLNEETAKKTS